MKKLFQKTLIFILIFAWIFSGFPPSIFEKPQEAHAATTAIRHEINIIDAIVTASGDDSAIIQLDTTKYTGGFSNVTYYFETVAQVDSGTLTVALERVNTATQDATISVTATSYFLQRTVFTPPVLSQTQYNINLANGTNPKVKAARIIILQSADPLSLTQTQIEIGNKETGKTNTATAALTNPKYWLYDSSKWDNATFYAEVTYKDIQAASSTIYRTSATTTNTFYQYIGSRGVSYVTVEAWGAGGGGSIGNAGGGGGGGGAYARSTTTVAQGSVNILGVGGGGNDDPATAGAAASSTYTGNDAFIVRAAGGSATNGNTAGAGGIVTSPNTIGATTSPGGAGGVGNTGSDVGGGGGGAGGPNGNGVTASGAASGAPTAGGRGNGNLGGLGGAAGFGNGSCPNDIGLPGNDHSDGAGGGGGADNDGGALCGGGTGGKPGGGGGSSEYASAVQFGGPGQIRLKETHGMVGIALEEDDGSFGVWTNVAQIVTDGAATSSPSRVRVSFAPNNGKNYRLVASTTASTASYDIYNAKIIVDQSSPTLLEPQYLLLNTADSGSTGLQNYQTLYDANEWSGTTNTYKVSHDATHASDESKLVDITAAPDTDLGNGSVAGTNQQIGGSAITGLVDDHEIDVNVTNTTGAVGASRILVQVAPTPPSITVSGTLYSNEGTTVFDCNAANKTIKASVKGGTATSGTCSAADGTWSVTGVSQPAIGNPLTIWVDGDATFRAAAVTKASSTSNNISSLNLFQNRVIVKHEGFTATSTTNADLDVYDGDNDADIQFSVSGTALSVNAGQALFVATGSEFAPGGTVTIHGNGPSGTFLDGSLRLATGLRQDGTGTTSILTLGGNALTLAGSFMASSTSKFTSGGATVTFNATTTGKNIYATSSPLGNVTFSGTGGGWTFGANASTTNFFINGGVSSVTAPSGLLSISGNYNATSTFTHANGTILFDGAGAQSIAGATSTSAFNHVQFLGGGTKSFWANASTTNLTIGTNVTLSAPALLTVSGNFASSQNFTHNSGEVFMTGTSNTLSANGASFNNLTIDPATAGTITVSGSDATVAGTLTVASGDTLSISSGRTLTHTGSGFSLSETVSGAGLLTFTDTSGGPGTGGTLSVPVRYDATNGDIAATTFDARTGANGYDGLVTLYSNSTSNRAVAFAAGTYDFNAGLELNTANVTSGDLTLDGNANAPTVNVGATSGNLDFVGTGAGGEIIKAGAGTWTVSGNADFTGGDFIPSTGGTLVMNGTSKTLTSSSEQYYNLTLSGTIITADALTATGTSLTLSGSTINLGGSATASGGATLSAGSIYPQTQPIVLTGASQTLTGGSGQAGALEVSGSYALSGSDLIVGTSTISSGGTLTIGAGRVYTSTSTLTIAGTVGGAGTTSVQHSNLTTGGTLSSNVKAGTTTSINLPARTFGGNLEVASGSTVVASAATTTLLGNYINNGTFTANGGDVLLNGTSQQTLSGTLSESSAFARLTIFNTSGTDATTSPSIIFANVASSTNTFYASSSPSASVKLRFPASATSTFQNLYWDGGAADTRIMPRSSTSGTRFGFAVPGSRLKISYVDFMDTNACSGDANLDATGGTNRDSGNNGCIDFTATAANISSAANQLFEVGQVDTANSQITVTGGSGSGLISATDSTGDLRIAIATSTVDMRFLTSDTSVTFSGVTNKIDQTITSGNYEGGGSVFKVDVTSNFATNDELTISGLTFTSFNSANAVANGLLLYLNGANDISANDTDDKTIAINGTLALADSGSPAEQNKLGEEVSSVTNAELFSLRLTPAGESVNITPVIQLSDLVGMVCGDLTTVELYADFGADGGVNGDDAVVGEPSCSISGNTGSLSFFAFATSTPRDYILRANVSNIDPGDKIAFSLAPSNVSANGVTSSESITTSGSDPTKLTHVRPSGTRLGGGGGTGGGSPASETPQGGATGGSGGSGAGGETPPPETPSGGGTQQGGGGDVFIPYTRFHAAVIEGLNGIFNRLEALVEFLADVI